MRQGQRIAVVIPALNEALAIGKVLDALPSWLDCVVVADNGSTDATARVAEDRGAIVVAEPRRGYGRACLAGVSVLPDSIDTLVFLDGDFSDVPQEMERLVDPVLGDRADLVVGARQANGFQKHALSIQQRVGNGLACYLIDWLWHHRFADLGPFRAIRVSTYDALDMADHDYGWTIEMQIKAVERGFRVCEVPVSYRQRIGRSKISGTVSGIVGASVKILSVIAVHAWRKVYGNLNNQPPYWESRNSRPN